MKKTFKKGLLGGCILGLMLSINANAWAETQSMQPNTNATQTTAKPFASAKPVPNYQEQAESPSFLSASVDAVLVRPVLLGATIVGTALFFVTLPFSGISGSVKQAQHLLIEVPAKATFDRCLGCYDHQED